MIPVTLIRFPVSILWIISVYYSQHQHDITSDVTDHQYHIVSPILMFQLKKSELMSNRLQIPGPICDKIRRQLFT